MQMATKIEATQFLDDDALDDDLFKMPEYLHP
jgi:hypothetical protein